MTILNKILDQKAIEVAALKQQPKPTVQPRKNRASLLDVFKRPTLQVISEVKRASPSKGIINDGVDPVLQAKTYEQAGAACISVLTDPTFFKGSFEDLQQVTNAVDIPVLCKEFVIDPIQIDYAYANGASVVLLIVAALNDDTLQSLYNYATNLGLDVLVEVHDVEELQRALAIDAKIIGVNNRNLKTFEVSLDHTTTIAKAFPFSEGRVLVSESGMKTAEDAAFVAQDGASAVLVGETLMKSGDIAGTLQSFQVKKPVNV